MSIRFTDPAGRILAARSLLAGREGEGGAAPTAWGLGILRGLLAEVSAEGGGAALTAACAAILDAQRGGEPAAWVAATASTFFPPDAVEGGVDLDALAVVRAPSLPAALRAAERLLRSGAFGILVLDLGPDPRLPAAAVARLGGLAARHGTAVLCLTEKPAGAPSLGAAVALRVEALRRRAPGGGFLWRVRALKDRRRAPGWVLEAPVVPPPGVR